MLEAEEKKVCEKFHDAISATGTEDDMNAKKAAFIKSYNGATEDCKKTMTSHLHRHPEFMKNFAKCDNDNNIKLKRIA